MEIAAIIVSALVVAWVLAARQAPLWLWVLVSGAALATATSVNWGAELTLIILWCGWLIPALLAIPPVRRALVTAPMLRMTRKALPPMSSTEREALEAGTVWFDADLFSGKPCFDRFLAAGAPKLSDEEQAFLDGPTEELCSHLDEWRASKEHRDLPQDIWESLRSGGFLGMIIPESYGGLGFSAQAHSCVVQKIATRSTTGAISVMVPNSLGPAELLLHYGTDAQKDHWLPRLARGEEIPCFALTSPAAGSDAAAMPDTGVVCHGMHEGAEVLGMRVTFDKRYITLAPIATLIGLAFKVRDPDGLLGDQEDLGITVALVPADHAGVNVGPRHDALKQSMMTGPVRGNDVFIPLDWIIGGQDRVGQGWRMLMDCLSAGRSISLPASSTAATKFCARNTGAYARVRRQFKVPIGRFEGIEEPLARIAGDTYLLEAARGITAAAVDAGEKPSVISALFKYQATERMRNAVNDAMDIHGGRGICEGPSNYLASAYQSVPVSITVEGANILTRTLIVFGQGAMRCHPWLLREMESAQANDLVAFDRAVGGHVRFLISNVARAFWHNLTGGRFAGAPAKADRRVRHWYGQLTRTSANFATVADACLVVLGGAFKRKEKLSGRFADILSEMYLASCVLRRFENDGRPAEDLPLVSWNLRRSLFTAQASLEGLLNNLPVKPLAWLLRRVVFPFGARWRPPSDRAGHRIASMLLDPGPQRDRLACGMYVNTDPEDPTGRLEHALRAVVAAEPIERRIKDAVRAKSLDAAPAADLVGRAVTAGVITADDAALVATARQASAFAIAVDDFGPEDFTPGGRPWKKVAQKLA
ncbi:MAG: acyl-CoA dehydrogenase [Planctomycetes bacterium]|nr:acyl-CoA dehydrogenase [Planctomycetota bacterium]